MTSYMSKKTSIPLFSTLFILAFLVQQWLENQNLVDSIGLWYTVICAFFYSAIIFLVLIGIAKLANGKKA